MNSSPAGYRDLLGALAAGADRLVDPAVPAGERRERMGRLALSIFIGSFVLAAAMALALPGVAGPAAMLAAISATLSVSWLAALSVAKAKAEPFAAVGMLAAAALALGGLVAVSGGGVSPLALLMAGLIAEPLWVYRGRKAGWAGCAALVASIAAASFLTIDSAGAQPWFWAPVLAYGASLGLRLAGLQPARASDNAPAFPYVGEAAIALRFSADGEIEDVPAAAPSGFEIDPVLLLGGGLLERVHVADRVQYMCALADIRSSAAPVRAEIRLRMPLAAGEPTSAVRYGLFELHAAGREQAVLRQVEETGRLREKLAEAERAGASIAAAKSRLLASVSHELRTPLNAIIGFSDMLLLELCGPLQDPRQREHVTLVRDSGHHLLNVVNAILDVSRIESGVRELNPEQFRFAEAVELCRSMIAGQAAAKQVSIHVALAREVSDLVADRRAVQQMLINLVSNAVKFTPEGGAMTIAAERVGSRLVFSVEDTGIGMAEEDLMRVGQPFTQVRNDYTRQFDGLGLGLSLVKGLVALHGGSMEIESAPGQGTKVEVSLPVNGPASAGADRLVRLEDARPKEKNNGKFRKTA